MARKSFSELVKATGVNYAAEYKMLTELWGKPACELFSESIFQGDSYGIEDVYDTSLEMLCNTYFEYMPRELVGTCRNTEQFLSYHKLDFCVKSPDFDALLTYCEYVLTFWRHANDISTKGGSSLPAAVLCKKASSVLFCLVERLHHKIVVDGVFIKLVPTDVIVSDVASMLPMDVSIRTFLYRHRSMAGNIAEKKMVLKLLGDQLEPRRREINDGKLVDAIFSLLNNMNIRHNNTEPGSKNYRSFVAGLNDKEIEQWYDHLYQMMLAAFSLLFAKDALSCYESTKNAIGA